MEFLCVCVCVWVSTLCMCIYGAWCVYLLRALNILVESKTTKTEQTHTQTKYTYASRAIATIMQSGHSAQDPKHKKKTKTFSSYSTHTRRSIKTKPAKQPNIMKPRVYAGHAAQRSVADADALTQQGPSTSQTSRRRHYRARALLTRTTQPHTQTHTWHKIPRTAAENARARSFEPSHSISWTSGATRSTTITRPAPRAVTRLLLPASRWCLSARVKRKWLLFIRMYYSLLCFLFASVPRILWLFVLCVASVFMIENGNECDRRARARYDWLGIAAAATGWWWWWSARPSENETRRDRSLSRETYAPGNVYVYAGG